MMINMPLFTEKEAAGFLRIGSLNVRVKKTTEAFNNLISSAGSTKVDKLDKVDRLNKPWGSVDSLQSPVPTVEVQIMAAPKQVPAKKKRPKDFPQLISMPIQMNQMNHLAHQPPLIENKEEYETDSDSAYGFGNSWSNS